MKKTIEKDDQDEDRWDDKTFRLVLIVLVSIPCVLPIVFIAMYIYTGYIVYTTYEPHPPLTQAIANGDYDRCVELLDQGADIEAKCDRYECSSPLLSAAIRDNYRIIDLLLKRGANINGLTNDGVTIYDRLTDMGRFEVAGYLRKRGAKRKSELANAK